jgi:predicted O-linked N-acetylglucosamine transferase (SPINDLY family)
MALAADLFRRAFSAFQQGRLDEAARAFRQLLRREPRHLAALNIQAMVLTAQKQYAEAERHLQMALKINAASDATFYNYGIVLKALGRPQEALEQFSQAVALNPANAESWNNRGTVFNDLGDPGPALADFDQAISLNPKYAAAIFNRSRSLTRLRRYDEALLACDQALALKPDMAEAWFGRGFVLHQLRRHEEAAAGYARACQIDPEMPFLKGSLLHQKMLICDWNGFDRLFAEVERGIAAGKLVAEPFGWQGLATSSRSLQRCAELFAAQRFPAASDDLPPRLSAADSRIRIGYLSGEFREQATSLLLVGVLEHHDPSRFEITAFDNGWDDHSATRRRINACVDSIIPIRELNDTRALAAIRECRIDILVNLNGYFGDDRMRLFAQRAAPLQVNYLGFPGTLGARYMDYIIADRVVIPPDQQEFYCERVAYLPNCYQANDSSREIADLVYGRAECGLPAHGFVFCCFNNAYKITPAMFACWMRILTQVEGSVLWLLEDSAAAAANLRREAAARGVDPSRIIFAGRLPPPEHLARHRCADLFLDTLPYNAHTTGSDALWVGLPLLTFPGETFAGRVAASLLSSLGLPELIAESMRDYERLAIELATAPARHAAIKQRLLANRLTTPLFDTALFTKNIEALYAAMFERHMAGLAPDHIG